MNSSDILEYFDKEISKLYINKNKLNESINYSLLNGGKRFRVLLLLLTIEALNGNINDGIPAALAIEMIHTYSLIHDDLPSMDNDDIRRGKPSNHIIYPEFLSILAGDSLNTDAFGLLSNSKYDDDIKVKLISLLSECSGSKGMILGQTLDIFAEGEILHLNDIENIHLLKTSKLFKFSLISAAIITRNNELIIPLSQLSEMLGLYYQIQDDILDITRSTEDLGKPSNSDLDSNKSTYTKILGLELSKNKLNSLNKQIKDLLETINFDNTNLSKLIEKMNTRSK